MATDSTSVGVNTDDHGSAAPHEAWECDGNAYLETDAGAQRIGPCLEHRRLPRPLTVQGVDQALADTDPAWHRAAVRAVRAAVATGRTFTADDLRDPPYNVPEPAHGAHWGALLMLLSRRGLIERVGDAASRRPSAAGRRISVWRGR